MASPKVEFVIHHGAKEYARVQLPPGTHLVGISAEATVRLEPAAAGGAQVLLIVDARGQVTVEKFSPGTSPTLLGGRPFSGAARLASGDVLTIGDYTVAARLVASNGADAAGDGSLPPEFCSGERYEVGERIAAGGMGEILRAREIRTRRVVAMKVLLPGTDQSHARRWRFIEEAQITAQLEHPNIVPIHELGCDARQQLFYTMKLVKGVTLQEIVDRLSAGDAEYVERYPLAMLLTIFQKICDALAFAHSKGVIHRDLKPANIMVGRFGEVLVMDWGLVKAVATPGQSVDEEPAGGPISIIDSARRDDESAFSTMSGSVLGTPNYMAPEQARGENNQLSPRTDIFALGAILYHLITLRPPFVGGSGPAVLERIKSGEPPLTPREYSLGVTEQTKGARRVRGTLPVRRFLPHLAGGEVSDSLSAVSMKALAHDPGHRYQKVEELQSEIIAFQSGFATAAEKAGAWKQARLFVRRNRAALAEETLRFHHGEALPTTCADWEPHLHRIRGCHEEKDHAEVYAAFDTRFFALFQDNPAAFRERLFAYILEHESAFVAAAQT